MTKKKIAIIGSGRIAKIIIDRTNELGIESHCFSWDEDDIACRYATAFYKIDIFNVNEITAICKREEIGGVIATTELTIYPAAQIANNLNLVGNDISVAQNITNKFWVRKKLGMNAKLKQPEYYIFHEGDSIVVPQKYPVIVKPIAAGGKRGIRVVYDENQLETAINEAQRFSRIEGVLIEQYLASGVECSVESISDSGKHWIIQVTQKDTSGPPRCNELGHHQPAKVDTNTRTKIESAIEELLTLVGIKNGPCHTEIKIMDNEIYLIELNARPGGDHITYPLTELSTGYPFVSGIIYNALGEFDTCKPQKTEDKYCGVLFYTSENDYLKDLFENCDNEKWLYKKNCVSDLPSEIIFNDEDNLNYFIYYNMTDKLDVEKESERIKNEKK